jgi:hypothetical protein
MAEDDRRKGSGVSSVRTTREKWIGKRNMMAVGHRSSNGSNKTH